MGKVPMINLMIQTTNNKLDLIKIINKSKLSQEQVENMNNYDDLCFLYLNLIFD
jgi:hypothetical protein